MATFNETLDLLTTQRNTLAIIDQLLQRVDPNKAFYVSNTCDYDKTRIEAIQAFLEVERAEVQSLIDCYLGLNVSGSCP